MTRILEPSAESVSNSSKIPQFVSTWETWTAISTTVPVTKTDWPYNREEGRISRRPLDVIRSLVPIPSTPDMKTHQVKRAIKSLLYLREGWDENGLGSPFNEDGLQWLQDTMLRQIQKGLPNPDSIEPITDGSVYLTWNLPSRLIFTSLEIDIEGKNRVGYWSQTNLSHGVYQKVSARDLDCRKDSAWDYMREKLGMPL